MIEQMKQALEALESADWYIDLLEMIVYSAEDNGTHEERIKIQQAITSLRQAISELEQRSIAELESQAQPKQVNELHTCPYRENLHGDYETLCACDEEATHQCVMDI